MKDLSKIGRDIRRMIIIDNIPSNFQNQPENGIFLKSWFEDTECNELMNVAPFLKQIVEREEDVRKSLVVVKQIFRNGMLNQDLTVTQ